LSTSQAVLLLPPLLLLDAGTLGREEVDFEVIPDGTLPLLLLLLLLLLLVAAFGLLTRANVGVLVVLVLLGVVVDVDAGNFGAAAIPID
jgi:hypothetical protein